MKKPKAKKCIDCKRRPARNRRSRCGPCLNKHWRAADPVRAAFNSLRASAKRRGKVFEITLEYFRGFCVKTEYLKGKGISAESYHVDRIDESLGYIEGNLQVLTNAANIKKYLEYDYRTREAKVIKTGNGQPRGDDMPF